MQITTTIDLKGTLKRLESLMVKDKDRKRALKLAAVGQMKSVKDRTADGMGLKGRFKSYSKPYAIFRRETGHGTKNVNLFYTGAMMNDMSVTSNYFQAEISFHRITERNKAAGLQRKRPFMGITRKEQKQIIKRFKGALFK